jgi:alkanesulfonate monooxygenase SsuD/methylene tetrahydromethanopterin reductase-like flavin-dependent oxidoreductase (luciferase family)
MGSFALRFDLRNPDFAGTTMASRYEAALSMTEWADRLGFASVLLSEHHGSDDGYLPSPLPMAAAMAVRTRHIRIQIAALVAPFYDPLRLAEDIAVVDLLSNGRLDVVIAAGYVAQEFSMFGREMSDRADLTTEAVTTLKQAWTGEPFEFRGRVVQVRPTPVQTGGPKIVLGGSGPRAARRAALIADGFMPTDSSIWGVYRKEMRVLGKPDPGPLVGGDTSAFHLARDIEKGWKEYAPYAIHELNAYGAWLTDAGIGIEGAYQPTQDVDAMRASGQYRVVTPDEMVAEIDGKGEGGFTILHPMAGGVPPAVAWDSLHLFEDEVLPKLGRLTNPI